jgi:hypothetical protein
VPGRARWTCAKAVLGTLRRMTEAGLTRDGSIKALCLWVASLIAGALPSLLIGVGIPSMLAIVGLCAGVLTRAWAAPGGRSKWRFRLYGCAFAVGGGTFLARLWGHVVWTPGIPARGVSAWESGAVAIVSAVLGAVGIFGSFVTMLGEMPSGRDWRRGPNNT